MLHYSTLPILLGFRTDVWVVVREVEDSMVRRNVWIRFHIGAASRPVPEERNYQTKYFETVENKKLVGRLLAY
jgi:hypothetical protein